MTERPLKHRDQVHGDTAFDAMCVALLDTPTMQRLGRVYQLGYAHLVFRGGTHTRLSHVMGSAHTAGRIVDNLVGNYSAPPQFRPPNVVDPNDFLPFTGKSLHERWDFLRHVTRWAALLHDLGHVPLGHTLEDEFDNIFEKHDDFASPRMPLLWYESAGSKKSSIRTQLLRRELYPDSFNVLQVSPDDVWRTVMLISLFKEKRGDVLSGRKPETFDEMIAGFLLNAPAIERKRSVSLSHQVKFVEELRNAYGAIGGRIFHPYMADIVGNTICADYLDYLQRDAANVGLDVLRDDRVISQFYVGQQQDGLYRMALSLVDRRGKDRLDTCTGVVELVRQRFRFAEIIYYHKTKVAASAMFAKAIRLLGNSLQETRLDPQPEITLEQIDRDIEILRRDKKSLASLRPNYLPDALMDVEIGDESLYVFLQSLAWHDIEVSVAKPEKQQDFELVRERLRALRLVRAITTRRLYKVALTIDAHTFADLSPGSKNSATAEERILPQIKKLRADHAYRSQIEDAMVKATSWVNSDDALILYVPPRKSQAKGIETFALDKDGVVTLSDHPAVQEKVKELNRDYTGLWRMILLVDPARRDDDVALSYAVDALIQQLWPKSGITEERILAIRRAAWFEYILHGERPAAKEFVESMRAGGRLPDWRIFRQVRDGYAFATDGIVRGRELADRAALATLVKDNVIQTKEFDTRFANTLLSAEVDKQIATLPVASSEGASDALRRMRAIEAIAKNLSAPQLLLHAQS